MERTNRNPNEYLPPLLNLIAAVVVVIISFVIEFRFPLSKGLAKPIGLLIVVAGMSLVVWSIPYLKEAFLGKLEPRLNVLVQEGSYRVVRHPVYLGMTIALIGLTIALRSWLGFLGVFLFYLPSVIYRARLEEKALYQKFGDEWENYAARTGFIIPLFRRG